jgi:hypothetical protein
MHITHVRLRFLVPCVFILPVQIVPAMRVSTRTTVAIGLPEHLLYEPHLVADPLIGGRWLAASIVRGSAPKYPDSQKDQTSEMRDNRSELVTVSVLRSQSR